MVKKTPGYVAWRFYLHNTLQFSLFKERIEQFHYHIFFIVWEFLNIGNFL